MKRLRVEYENRTLTMAGPIRRERLSIRNGGYPWNGFSEQLFASLGTMHLIAPYLPESVQGNFDLPKPIRELMGAMYTSEGKSPPMFKFPGVAGVEPPNHNPDSHRVAIAYSAGKDSMWNLWWISEKYGMNNVLVVHVRNLNRNNGSNELKYVLKQQERFGIRHLKVVELKNSSLNTGYQVMRSRDMFLAGIIVPLALQFGATKIFTEGFADAKPAEPFTGLEENMRYFNGVLKEIGAPARVSWRNRDEMLVIRDLFKHRPAWMPYVCNCFTIPPFLGFHKRAFQRRFPSFPLYESQCGVCVKCRITNLGRVLYDHHGKKIVPRDTRGFLEETNRWAESKLGVLSDMIQGPFLRDLRKACQLFRIEAKSVV